MSNKLELLGAITFIIGFIVTINSVETITGYAIYNRLYGSIGSFFGAFFIILGVLIIKFSKNYQSKKEVVSGVK